MQTPMSDYQSRYDAYRLRVEEYLHASLMGLPEGELRDAMVYSLFGGGKLLRPVLTLAACDLADGVIGDALPFAGAVEMIHTYSLIHDDLPCMDNDSLRRGRPTNHVVYGEDMAVLAGDGLLSWAFETMLIACSTLEDPRPGLLATQAIAHGCGALGMVYGQSLDIKNEGRPLGEQELRMVHRNKTGALIKGALLAGAHFGFTDALSLHAVRTYGENLGVAFQIADDVLDATQSAEVLGKTPHKDQEAHKTTYVTLYGVEGARQLCQEYTDRAVEALAPFPKSGFLIQLAQAYAKRVR